LGKLILFVVGLLIVYWIVRGYRRRVDGRTQHGEAEPAKSEDMVRCVQCGVHLPRGESIATQGKFFCSAEHQRLHRPPD
jgi:uncharacterized protein